MDAEEHVKVSFQSTKEDITFTDFSKDENNQCENSDDHLEVTDIEAVEHNKGDDCLSQDLETKEALLNNHETTGGPKGDDSDSSGASIEVPVEREEGDGQESDIKDKKLDRDEDKRDPQYIPRKGNFYEHDDRTSEDEEPPNGKKHFTQKAFESKERWSHDLYDDNLQSPKSREELIEQYGYDIRLEEGPPKVRQRRRYGCGPNKCTRRWEEEAYAHSRGSWRGRGLGRPYRNSVEDFRPLPDKKAVAKATLDENNPENKQDSVKKESTIKTIDSIIEKKDTQSGIQSLRRVKIDESSVNTPSRGQGSTRGKGKVSQPFKSGGNFQRQSSIAEKDIATLSKHFAEAVINLDNKSIPLIRASSVRPTNSSELNGIKNQQSSQDTVLDKSGTELKSKRYSMQRQRSLPQATSNGVSIVQQAPQPPPFPQHYIQPEQQQYFHQVGHEATPSVSANQYTNQAHAN